MVSNGGNEGGAEIAFFDVETTIPTRPGQKYALLEFGSILVCPKTLVELDNYSTLIRPDNPSLISTASVNCNGITRDDVVSAPSFSQVADTVYNLLNGRVWAGHNIIRFDCVRIKEAFAEINRPPPEPKGIIDSLPLLTQTFGRRAGNMKMATLATYFGLGQQTHRSLGDVRMNLEVIKHCATVLFLESSLPDIFTSNSLVSLNATTRSRGNWGVSPEETIKNKSTVSSSKLAENHTTSSPIDTTIGENLPTCSTTNPTIGENHPTLSLQTSITEDSVVNQVESDIVPRNRFNMTTLSFEMERESLQLDDTVMESGSESVNSIPANSFDASSGCMEFLKPNEVSLPSLTVILSPYYRGLQRLQILHRNTALHLCCSNLKVRFGISTKFVDIAGRPRLSFVADAHPDICRVLDACDSLAQKMSLDSGSGSEWRSVVTRKYGFVNSPTIRLHLPTVPDGNAARWTTEMYHKESSTTQRIVFSRYDVTELDALFVPGTNVDAYFSLDPYDYLQTAEMDMKQAMSDGSGSGGDETNYSLTKAARILLCDPDVESCRENFTLLRQCSDYQVTTVISASEVMSALNSWGPETDLILADASLLMSSGAQLLKNITQNQDFIHIPVIMMLVEEDVSLILKGLGLGAADYVMKPLSATEVLNLWTHISKTRHFP